MKPVLLNKKNNTDSGVLRNEIRDQQDKWRNHKLKEQ